MATVATPMIRDKINNAGLNWDVPIEIGFPKEFKGYATISSLTSEVSCFKSPWVDVHTGDLSIHKY